MKCTAPPPGLRADTAGIEARPEPEGTDHGHSHLSPTNHRAADDPVIRIPFEERPLTPYPYLRSKSPTALDPARPGRRIALRATGDMERYVWTFNDRTLKESDLILIRKGENVRIDFVNDTMMHHPIHLHGHFFRVLNQQGDHSPLKHTFDLPPLASQSIEFQADEDKDWLLHCHILYHMEAGMHQIVHYQGSVVDPDIAEARTWKSNHLRHDPWYAWFNVSLLSQMTEGSATAANTRNTFGFRWENGWKNGDREAEAFYCRYVNRFFSVFAGGYFTPEETVGIVGFTTLLPLLLEGRAWVNHRGDVRLSLERELQLTDRLSLAGGGSLRHAGDLGMVRRGSLEAIPLVLPGSQVPFRIRGRGGSVSKILKPVSVRMTLAGTPAARLLAGISLPAGTRAPMAFLLMVQPWIMAPWPRRPPVSAMTSPISTASRCTKAAGSMTGVFPSLA